MEIKEISQKSAKKEIWDAYAAILEELQKKQEKRNNGKDDAIAATPITKETDLKQADELNIEKAIQDISNLKIVIQAALNKLSDKLTEELKKLESINKAVKTENENLENVYKIKNEADILFNIIETREQKRAEFQKQTEEWEEKLKTDIEKKRKLWEREQEEYEYNLKILRKKEQDDYEFRRQIRERDFNEKIAAREKDLKTREAAVLEKENEFKALKIQTDNFPKDLEKRVYETTVKLQGEAGQQAKIKNDLMEKEIAKEREIAKLKIFSLEDIIKKQTLQINGLESHLAAASQKAQELAVKIIEAGSERDKKRQPSETEKETK